MSAAICANHPNCAWPADCTGGCPACDREAWQESRHNGHMSGLIDFLLARIAEDRAVAMEAITALGALDWTSEHDLPAVGMAASDGPSGYTVVVVNPARVVAECEAKRRIIDYAGPIANDETLPSFQFAYRVLVDLCLPYSEHPEFLEKWRP